MHTIDMDVHKLVSLEPRCWEFISQLEPRVGFVELVHDRRDSHSGDLMSIIRECKEHKEGAAVNGRESGHNIFSKEMCRKKDTKKPKIAVVGSGPSGLFATLVLAELGADVTLIERGQPVEKRGRDIGALVVRRILELESNFCFGEVVLLFIFIDFFQSYSQSAYLLCHLSKTYVWYGRVVQVLGVMESW